MNALEPDEFIVDLFAEGMTLSLRVPARVQISDVSTVVPKWLGFLLDQRRVEVGGLLYRFGSDAPLANHAARDPIKPVEIGYGYGSAPKGVLFDDSPQAGVQWRYLLLPLVLLLIPMLYMVPELTVRLGIYTGRGHGELIRERFGRMGVAVGGAFGSGDDRFAGYGIHGCGGDW